MKRSEMVKLLHNWINEDTHGICLCGEDECDDRNEEIAINLLDKIEEAGMEPPYAGGDITYGNEWEKE